jgi:hypothetical protein
MNIMKKTYIFLFKLIFVCFSIFGQNETSFFNLQWRDNQNEVLEAHLNEGINIYFETNNIPENTIIDIEIYRKKDGKLIDLIKKLQGKINNNKIEIYWTIEIDIENKNTSYYKEIKKNNYAIIDYVFVIKYNKKNISSKILEILGEFRKRIVDEYTGEPYRFRNFAVYSPDGNFIFGTTDEEGYTIIRNLRKIGYYSLIT